MNKADFQKIKQIFTEISESPLENREEILLKKCGGDSSIFDEVRSLLAAHDEAENLIEKNALNFDSQANINEDFFHGKQFGNYKIIREIGRGGMGAVFLAERNDGEFTHRVALKIVRQTISDSETERRFRLEREILASLNHPNIAQLHDGGVSASGEAFLAMEYVEGKNLLEFAADKELSINEKLRLFLKICKAVSYAHRNLTIHRDLKPSNILVDQEGEPKLLDFGLAKILDENLLDVNQTATMFHAFTPAYASPEQIQGKTVTTTSDVYSLGVVFYELMAGDKPFHLEGKSLEEIVRALTNTVPPAPSLISNSRFRISNAEKPNSSIHNQKLNADIDNIALKALQNEPERRYRTVEEFAGDVERHLNGMPILAHPNTFLYRSSKFFRRNTIAVTATVIVVFSIFTGLIFTLWQANETRKERDRAEKRFNDVRKLSNSLLFEIAPKIENLNGSTEAREILVKRALEFLDSLAIESNNDPNLYSDLASAYEKVGDLQGNPNKPNLSDLRGAIKSYEKANQIRQNLPQSDETRILLAKNFLQMSVVRYQQNDVKGSIQNSNAALEIYEDLITNSNSIEIKTDYLEAGIDNAQIYADNNQFKTAIPLFEKTLSQIRQTDSNDKQLQRVLVKANSYYANALSWDGRQTEAETEMQKSVQLAEKLFTDYPNDTTVRFQVWRTFSLAASIYEGSKNHSAFAFAKKALEIAQSAVAADNADSQAKLNLAKSFSRLGNEAVLLNKLPEALEYLKESETILDELTEKEPKNIAYQRDFGRLYIRLGDFYRKQIKFRKALENYERSVEYFEKISELDDQSTLAKRDMAQSMKNLGEIQSKLGEIARARVTFEKTLSILRDLKSQNALGEYDERLIGEIQSALQDGESYKQRN